jgi:hypothetical protein
MLKDKGLIPFIEYPNMCAKCGELWPEMFRVSDAVVRYGFETPGCACSGGQG